MKKLMIAAAIVCAAAFTQASTVTWKSYNTTTGKNTFLVDSTGAQVASGDFATLGVNYVLVALAGDDLTAYKAGTYVADYDSTKVLSQGKISTSTKAAAKGSFGTPFEFTYNETTPALNPIKDGDVLAVLVTDGKNMSNVSYYGDGAGMVVDTFTVTGLDGESGDKGLYNKTFNFATAGNFTSEVQGVPEPTSAMLLVLGLGALALRRRRA